MVAEDGDTGTAHVAHRRAVVLDLLIPPRQAEHHRVVEVEMDILDRVTIDAAGKGKTVLARKDETWTIASRNNQPANSVEVKRLLDLVQAEQRQHLGEDGDTGHDRGGAVGVQTGHLAPLIQGHARELRADAVAFAGT